MMERFIKTFLVTFIIVGLINQSFYNFCFSEYCLSAAFPKVLILSLIVAAVVYFVVKEEKSRSED